MKEKERDSSSSTISNAANVGKAISKGAAVGPHGMLVAGLWEGRHILTKLLLGGIACLLLPVIFILMLPSLLFGTNVSEHIASNALNDNRIVLANMEQAGTKIEELLREKHQNLIAEIQSKVIHLGANSEYYVVDEFSDQIIYESTLILSQYCAYQEDYEKITLKDMEATLRKNMDGIFTYEVSCTSRKEIDPITGEPYIIDSYEYQIIYAGDSYFAEHVFHLTPEQMELADSYAGNLQLFLSDTIHIIPNPDLVPGETVNTAVDLALSKLGTPYSQEHRNEEGYFDCSSFTFWVYQQLGVVLQYDGVNTAAAQGRYITEQNLAISYENLAPGDLIFYSLYNNNRYMNITHVAIYAGNGYLIDASTSEKMVVYRPIYSTKNIVLCGRPYAGS